MSGSRLPRPRHPRSTSHVRTLPFPDLPITPSPSRPTSPRPTFSTSAPSASGSGSSTPMGRQRSATAATTSATAVMGRSLPSSASLSAGAAGSSSTSLVSSAPSGFGAGSGSGLMPAQATSPIHASFGTSPPAPPPPAASAVFPMHVAAHSQPVLNVPLPTPSTAPPAPASVAAPIATHSHLDDHLLHSFLHGTCADIKIRIRKWGVAYHLHRMILVQAGFFHSLFLGGFSEGRARDMGDGGIETIDLEFDDPNITRAAFEICISRLYSNKPALNFPTSLLPTPFHPLTAHFLHRGPAPAVPTPADPSAQLATPHLLLSLIATAIYLGQTRLLREALALTLRTVSPWTISRYLRFAIGESIGEAEWPGQKEEPARGMEGVARMVSKAPARSPSRADKGKGRAMSPDGHLSRKASAIDPIIEEAPSSSAEHDHVKCRGPKTSAASGRDLLVPKMDRLQIGTGSSSTQHKEVGSSGDESADCVEDDEEDPRVMPHFYGFASNKIGEACACWLARWAPNILAYEEAAESVIEDAHCRLHPLLRIFGHDGLPARWLRAVLAADVLFVKDEMERYCVARRVMDLRKRGWEKRCAEVQREGTETSASWEEEQDEWEEEERELEEVFASGVYYTHMTFDELSNMSLDINPATDMPFVPMHVLQAAHWSAADLRTRITQSKANIGNASDIAKQELGLACTAADLAKRLSRVRLGTPRMRSHGNASLTSVRSFSDLYSSTSPSPSPSRLPYSRSGFPGYDPSEELYYPVVYDETLRIGDGGFLFLSNPPGNSSVDLLAGGLPDLGPDLTSSVAPVGGIDPHPKPPMGESSFFGIGPSEVSAREIEELWRNSQGAGVKVALPSKHGAMRWSRLEPFRFSVEFWGLDGLAEKQRAYSSTHFYAGSYFNVYVQTVRKKDKPVQLGIYLNRTSNAESFPTPSSPEQSRVEAASGSPERSSTEGPAVEGTYKDPRDVTRAYFSISCASALGTAMIRFSSAPDSFTSSQSWGWKSVSLRTEEYLSHISPDSPSAAGAATESIDDGVLGWVGLVDEDKIKGLVSLRATVVMAVI